ncbi:MAG TPA: tRNA-dihydrouridine synthase [Candidatus Paceibacterota bacterium]|nr:tRNA-dihydrouridine synthase [Candidatus Paceibacterota bacterium]
MAADTSFWDTLPRPYFSLAPMEDVTDAAFRHIIASKGKPDVFFTEFTSADGLVLAPPEGHARLARKLIFGADEHRIVAQLFTAVPAHMEEAAAMCRELGFDGIDINMGCPDKAIEKTGCGSAMIRTPALAKEIIRAAKRGAKDIPVSAKTRIGYRENELPSWLPALLEEEPANVTIHARTRAQMSKVPAQWERIAEAVAIRDRMGSRVPIAGNGDVADLADARAKAAAAGCDGVMLGRAIFGNPWLFYGLQERRAASSQRDAPAGDAPERAAEGIAPAALRTASLPEGLGTHPDLLWDPYVPSARERIEALIAHIEAFDRLLTGYTSFAVMKKHFKAYINGWDHASDLRARLMETTAPAEAIAILTDALDSVR